MTPWMRRRTHMRLHVKQGEAYRREIEEARMDAARARVDLQRFVDALAPHIVTDRDWRDGSLRIQVIVERRLLERDTPHELMAMVRDSIMRRLTDANRDYRGDLRQTPTQRVLGVELAERIATGTDDWADAPTLLAHIRTLRRFVGSQEICNVSDAARSHDYDGGTDGRREFRGSDQETGREDRGPDGVCEGAGICARGEAGRGGAGRGVPGDVGRGDQESSVSARPPLGSMPALGGSAACGSHA